MPPAILAIDQGTTRTKALVVPPAWHDVWIRVAPRGHLLATGRVVRGRRQ